MRLAPLRREPLRRASLHALPRPRRRLLSLSLPPPDRPVHARGREQASRSTCWRRAPRCSPRTACLPNPPCSCRCQLRPASPPPKTLSEALRCGSAQSPEAPLRDSASEPDAGAVDGGAGGVHDALPVPVLPGARARRPESPALRESAASESPPRSEPASGVETPRRVCRRRRCFTPRARTRPSSRRRSTSHGLWRATAEQAAEGPGPGAEAAGV